MKLTACYARSWQSRSDARARPLMENHLWLRTATSRSQDWAGNPALLLTPATTGPPKPRTRMPTTTGGRT
jgi:hypothetical protein